MNKRLSSLQAAAALALLAIVGGLSVPPAQGREDSYTQHTIQMLSESTTGLRYFGTRKLEKHLFLDAAMEAPVIAARLFNEGSMIKTANERRPMSEPILYIDKSEIREGKSEELKAAIKELVAFVDANEPQLISYNFYFNEDLTRMTVVAVHPDSASMEFHMKVGGPIFRKFAPLITLSSIEVYGQVNDTVMKQLQQKAQMLGHGGVLVHRLQSGFTRVETR